MISNHEVNNISIRFRLELFKSNLNIEMQGNGVDRREDPDTIHIVWRRDKGGEIDIYLSIHPLSFYLNSCEVLGKKIYSFQYCLPFIDCEVGIREDEQVKDSLLSS